MATGINGSSSNPFSAYVSTAFKSAGNGANQDTKALTTNVRSNITTVENYLATSLKQEGSILKVIDSNATYSKSQLLTMQEGLQKITKSALEMKETIIAAKNKSPADRTVLRSELVSKANLVNQQIWGTKFNGMDLLAANFSLSVRTSASLADSLGHTFNAIVPLGTNNAELQNQGGNNIADNTAGLQIDTDVNADATETAIDAYINTLRTRAMEVASYIKAVDEVSENLGTRALNNNETAKRLSENDAVESATSLQENVSKISSALAAGKAGGTLSAKILRHVEEVINS